MKSIRRDLTVQVVSRVLPLILLGSVAVYVAVRQVVIGEFDAVLKRQMEVLAAAAERVGPGMDFDYGPERDTRPDFVEGLDYYFQATLSDGSVLKQSADLRGRALFMEPAAQGVMRIGPVALPGGKVGRGCVYVFEPRVVAPDEHSKLIDRPVAPAGPVTLVIGATTSDFDRPLAALAITELLVSAVLMGATIVALHRTVRKGLGPVNELAQQVTEIEPGNLAARVDMSGQPAELTPIAARLNDLLARVEDAFSRERRFTANAAHELRTPIAEIRAIAEVAAGAAEKNEQTRDLQEIVKVCEEMQATISTLLAISRAKSGVMKVELRTVDLSSLLTEWCAKRAAAPGGAGRIERSISSDLLAQTDPSLLSSIANNLLDNALAYTPDGAAVSVRAGRTAEGVRVEVENPCAGLTESDLRDMFDPFWRKRGTTAEGSHSGLGLALVRALCEALGASVCARFVGPQRLCVHVDVPRTVGGA